MFATKTYRIIESKEEFLKEWNGAWRRYARAAMPRDFDVDTATFPLALGYRESFDERSCGDWDIKPLEEVRANILQAYKEEMEYLMKRTKDLEGFEG